MPEEMPEGQIPVPEKYQRDIPLSEIGALVSKDFSGCTGPISRVDVLRFVRDAGIVKQGDNSSQYVDGRQLYQAAVNSPGWVINDERLDSLQDAVKHLERMEGLAMDLVRKYMDSPEDAAELVVFVDVMRRAYNKTKCRDPGSPFEVKRAQYNREYQEQVAKAEGVSDVMLAYQGRLARECQLLSDEAIELSTRQGNRAELKDLIEKARKEGEEVHAEPEKLIRERESLCIGLGAAVRSEERIYRPGTPQETAYSEDEEKPKSAIPMGKPRIAKDIARDFIIGGPKRPGRKSFGERITGIIRKLRGIE